ncbi:MAG TPA: hypothetical protein PL110_07915 [Candidatus Eremiobacteraeota bacterium]|nr:hypothetical protein [Candidatus Eremiobacteraeota bacterium]
MLQSPDREKGRHGKRQNGNGKKMLEDKVDINVIAKYTGLMIEEIKGLMKDRD